MSDKDKQRWLRQLVCEGCELHCRYEDFRAFGPHAGGFAPRREKDRQLEYDRRKRKRRGEVLPHGNTGRRHVGQQEFGAEMRSAVEVARKQDSFVTKRNVLGSMHKTKMALWLEYTSNCPGAPHPSTPPACLSE